MTHHTTKATNKRSLDVKALTIKQPWAWAIVSGHKDVENRSWATSYRGPILIHAGKARDDVREEREYDDWLEMFGLAMPPDSELVYGAIIGIAELVDCVVLTESHPSQWASDEGYGWELRNARKLARPIPCNGALGLWNSKLDLGRILEECTK